MDKIIAITIFALLALATVFSPAFVHAQTTVIIQQQPVEAQPNPLGYLNWNIQRNAAINDALRYDQLKLPLQIQVQQIPVIPQGLEQVPLNFNEVPVPQLNFNTAPSQFRIQGK